MNLCFLLGRVANEPQVRYTSGDGKAIAQFSFAVNKYSKNGTDSADFFRCSAFGKTAECIEKHVKKGTKLALEGSFHNDNYTDQNGIKRYDFVFTVNQLEFCEKKSEEDQESGSGSRTMSDVFSDAGIDEDLPFN